MLSACVSSHGSTRQDLSIVTFMTAEPAENNTLLETNTVVVQGGRTM